MKSLSKATIKVRSVCIYTGKVLKPGVTVILGGKTLRRQTDYTVSWENNTKVGTAKVVVKGVGRYNDKKTKNFTIKPKKAAISKVTVGKKKITVKMKTKVSATGGTKYKVQYRIAGKGKWKTVTTSSQSVTIKKLKKGKKYQVRVLAVKGARVSAISAIKKSGKVKK